MIKASARPAPHAVPRSVLAAVEIMSAATVAHGWAGGALPSTAWLLGVSVLVFGASLLVIRGRAPLRWMVPGLTAAQLLLHCLLEALAPVDHVHGHVAGATPLGLTWQMLAAHAASAAVTALVWRLRRRLVEAVLRQPSEPVPVSVWRSEPRSLGGLWAVTGRAWLVCVPRRGPPARPGWA